MLAPAFDVLREILNALCDFTLALPRHAFALTQRKRRRKRFQALRHATLSPPPKSPPNSPPPPLKHLLLSCGDASGEDHALRLLQALQVRHPQLEVSGFGGARLKAAGMEVWQPLADLNVMGFRDVAAQLPLFFAAVYRFAKALHQHPPDLVVLVDYPGLNRHLLRIAKRKGVPVVDYIAPQLWAWAAWRIRDFRRADALLTILPFEEDWYGQHQAKACFIGHPLADRLLEEQAKDPWTPPPGADEWIAILPGSRHREVRENLPLLLDAAACLLKQRPQTRFVLPHLRADLWPLLQQLLDAQEIPVLPVPGMFHQVLAQCRGAWVVSGTASLEVAALGIPSVVVYQMSSKLGAYLARHALAVPFVGGANLVAGRSVAPEVVGAKLKPEILCQLLLQQLEEPRRGQVLQDLAALHTSAFLPGTAQRAAMALESTFFCAPHARKKARTATLS